MEILNIDLEEKTDQTVRVIYRDDTTNLPVDITGYSAVLQIRPQFGSEILIDELSTGAATIVLGGSAGTVDIIFTPSDSDQAVVTTGWIRGTYDLILIDTLGSRKKLLKGFITIARSSSI